MTAEESKMARLLSSDVAALLGVSQATVTRIPRDRLDYWTTPGGWRRYRLRDVAQYARNYMGMEINENASGDESQ